MSESERKRRRENNRFSTKINFLAWLVEVETLIKTFSLKIWLIEVPKLWLKTFISLKILIDKVSLLSAFGCPSCHVALSSEQRGKVYRMGILVDNSEPYFCTMVAFLFDFSPLCIFKCVLK